MGKICENVCKITLPLSHPFLFHSYPFLSILSYPQHPLSIIFVK